METNTIWLLSHTDKQFLLSVLRVSIYLKAIHLLIYAYSSEMFI